MGQKKLLTARAIFEIYGINKATIYFWIRNKKFRYIKVGKSIFIRELDFIEFLDQHTVGE